VLFGWELQNLNVVQQNAAGIDLVDTTNKIIVQVSATATKQKIESALAKGNISGERNSKDVSGASRFSQPNGGIQDSVHRAGPTEN
jgi:hypothetical protein